jgi:chemotaxis protein MotB
MARRQDPPRRARRRREEHADDHGGAERWLVTYADMLTLLFVLFVVLFAMSHLDETKYQELKQGLAAGFGTATSLLTGEHSILPGNNADSPGVSAMDTTIGSPVTPTNVATSKEVQAAVQQAMAQMTQRNDADAKAQVTNLIALWHKIQGELKAKGLADDVQAAIDARGLVISLVSKHIVFPANLATLTPRGTKIVDTIAPVLASLTEHIEVDGNTNQVKVHPLYYPTDWDLAAARAIRVTRRLNEHDGIPNNRMSIKSWGHTKPLVPVGQPGWQELNKRVDIIILSDAPADTRAAYQQAYSELTGGKNPNDIGDTTVSGDENTGAGATTGLSPAAQSVLSSLNTDSSSNSGGNTP